MLAQWLYTVVLLLLLPINLFAQETYLVAYAGFAGFQAPVWAPKDLGSMAKYGFNGDVVLVPGSVRQIQAVLGGSIHLAQVDAATGINAINQGADIVMISGTLNNFPYSFVTQKEIRKPEDLPGKKIGILAVAIYAALRFLGRTHGSGMVRGLGLIVLGLFLAAQVIIASFDLTVLGSGLREGAVLAPGTILTSSTPVYDLVRGEIYRSTEEKPLEIPAGSVVVPGSRAVTGGRGPEWGLSLYASVIVKYRDEKTDRAVQLEGSVR